MKKKILALAFAALMPFAAFADGVSYSYFDLSYQLGSIDPSFDTDGIKLNLNYAVNDAWFVAFDYQTLGTDPDVGNIDEYALYGGWHNDLFFAKAGYQSLDLAGTDDAGLALDFGLRSMVTDAVELNGHLAYADLGNLSTFTTIGVGGVWMFGDNMGVSFNYDTISSDIGADSTQYGFGFRFNFN